MVHFVGSCYADNSEQLICDLHKRYTFYFVLLKCIQWKNMRSCMFNKMHTYIPHVHCVPISAVSDDSDIRYWCKLCILDIGFCILESIFHFGLKPRACY
jgi:hypothetical protein